MKMRPLGNHLTLYLLALCALLTGVLALESRNLIRTQEEGATAAKAQAAAPVGQTPFRPPGIMTFNEITERPLFVEGRKPPPKPVAAKVVRRQQQPLRLKLEGIAITPDASVAVLRDLGNNEIVRLQKGMKHKGWELTEIGAAGVTFGLGGQDQEITLYVEDQDKKGQSGRQ
jgi:hypothetical protein